MFLRRMRANGIIAITAKPFGTTNQNRPGQSPLVGHRRAHHHRHGPSPDRDDRADAKAEADFAIGDDEIMRIANEAVLIAKDSANRKTPSPTMIAKPSAGVRSAVSDRIDLSIANLLTRNDECAW